MGFWYHFDQQAKRISTIALVVIVTWLVLPFPKTFQAKVDLPEPKAPIIRVIPVDRPVVPGTTPPPVVTPPPSAPRTIWWPPLYLVVVIGATIVAVAAVRTFKPNPKTGVVAPAAAATASVTVLGLITAGLLQFEDKLGDQGYLLAILIGCFTIAPLVGRQFQTWQTKAWVTGLLLAAMIGGFATIFSLRYALGPEDVVTKQPTVVSGWEWLLSDLGSVTPGVWGSALVLVIVFLTNLTLTFWKPKGS